MSSGVEPLNKCSIPFDRRPYVKSGENWSSGFREEDVFKVFMILYMYITQGQGQITHEGQNFNCNLYALLL